MAPPVNENDSGLSTEISVPPRYFSVEFHARFFPAVLGSRLGRGRKDSTDSSFSSTRGLTITLAACLILGVSGVKGSAWHERPSYDRFLPGIFFFLVSGGILLGIANGLDHHSPAIGAISVAIGLILGYGIGIFFGLFLHGMGWLAQAVSGLAGLAAIILGAASVILLLGVSLR